MSIHAIYRIGVWLPIATPAAVALVIHGMDVTLHAGPGRKVAQVLLMSLLYGGVPYGMLAAWATWWIGGRSEEEITRLMNRAPFLMVGATGLFWMAVGLWNGIYEPFIAVTILSAVIIVPLGYLYVCMVMLMRRWLGPSPARH